MNVLIIKKSVQTGVHRGKKDEVVDVPDEVGKNWIVLKFAREASASEVKASNAQEEKSK
jgi:hypothetical protein